MQIKFSKTELSVFNLIRSGATLDNILKEKIVAQSSLPSVLGKIYKKTENLVKYHTQRDKFKELSCFIRNNPNEFENIPNNKKVKITDYIEPKHDIKKESPKIVDIIPKEIDYKATVTNILDKIDEKIHRSQLLINAKSEILDEVYKEFNNAGLILRK